MSYASWPGGPFAVVGMSVYWAADIAALAVCMAVFTHRHPVGPALVVGYATGYALTRRSLPLAGAGAVEALLPFALSWVGYPLATAILAVMPTVGSTCGLRSSRQQPDSATCGVSHASVRATPASRRCYELRSWARRRPPMALGRLERGHPLERDCGKRSDGENGRQHLKTSKGHTRTGYAPHRHETSAGPDRAALSNHD